jgi:hypothetical protein
MRTPRLICRRLLVQAVRRALPLAALIAGSNKAVRMLMIAMTTNNSISVNPLAALGWPFMHCFDNANDGESRFLTGLSDRSGKPFKRLKFLRGDGGVNGRVRVNR